MIYTYNSNKYYLRHSSNGTNQGYTCPHPTIDKDRRFHGPSDNGVWRKY